MRHGNKGLSTLNGESQWTHHGNPTLANTSRERGTPFHFGFGELGWGTRPFPVKGVCETPQTTLKGAPFYIACPVLRDFRRVGGDEAGGICLYWDFYNTDGHPGVRSVGKRSSILFRELVSLN
jgi:hypothetical protein